MDVDIDDHAQLASQTLDPTFGHIQPNRPIQLIR